MSTVIPFFATAADLIDPLLAAECLGDVKYVYVAFMESGPDHGREFASARDLALGSSPSGDRLTDPKYLVLPRDSTVASRTTGTDRKVLDQSVNTESIVLRPGGLFEGRAMISGEIATVPGNPIAEHIFKTFAGSITKRFRRVGAYLLGPEAERLYSDGMRLTPGIRRPRIQDLSIAIQQTASP